MKKKVLALLVASVMVIGTLAGCGSDSGSGSSSGSEASSASSSSSSSSAVAEDLGGIFPEVAGYTYANLFEVILDEQYDDIWLKYATDAVGEENAEDSVAMLKAYISSDKYGQEAIDAGETVFDCWYINGAKEFTFDGNTVSILLEDGSEESYTYEYIGVYKIGEGESMEYNGEAFDIDIDVDVYQATEDAGEFTYILLRDDTMEATYHIEFRYGSNLEDLQGYFVGPYAYWLAAGIDADASEEVIDAVIELFVTENLSE